MVSMLCFYFQHASFTIWVDVTCKCCSYASRDSSVQQCSSNCQLAPQVQDDTTKTLQRLEWHIIRGCRFLLLLLCRMIDNPYSLLTLKYKYIFFSCAIVTNLTSQKYKYYGHPKLTMKKGRIYSKNQILITNKCYIFVQQKSSLKESDSIWTKEQACAVDSTKTQRCYYIFMIVCCIK